MSIVPERLLGRGYRRRGAVSCRIAHRGRHEQTWRTQDAAQRHPTQGTERLDQRDQQHRGSNPGRRHPEYEDSLIFTMPVLDAKTERDPETGSSELTGAQLSGSGWRSP
jgi:hypothetical protein